MSCLLSTSWEESLFLFDGNSQSTSWTVTKITLVLPSLSRQESLPCYKVLKLLFSLKFELIRRDFWKVNARNGRNGEKTFPNLNQSVQKWPSPSTCPFVSFHPLLPFPYLLASLPFPYLLASLPFPYLLASLPLFKSFALLIQRRGRPSSVPFPWFPGSGTVTKSSSKQDLPRLLSLLKYQKLVLKKKEEKKKEEEKRGAMQGATDGKKGNLVCLGMREAVEGPIFIPTHWVKKGKE